MNTKEPWACLFVLETSKPVVKTFWQMASLWFLGHYAFFPPVSYWGVWRVLQTSKKCLPVSSLIFHLCLMFSEDSQISTWSCRRQVVQDQCSYDLENAKGIFEEYQMFCCRLSFFYTWYHTVFQMWCYFNLVKERFVCVDHSTLRNYTDGSWSSVSTNENWMDVMFSQ